MAKKGRTQDRHKSPRKVFHLSRELADALESHVKSVGAGATESGVLREALAEYLARRGSWKENGQK
jgi:Arc/MetJ-type ribon-helix-helix transcriptional regulator